jgi:hypothetical protein
VNCPEVIYRSHSGATPEAELSALTAIYRYVLFSSQARKGDPHDLMTSDSPAESVKNGPQKNGKRET